ncbi:MAG: SEL1-like repeat protein [Planctomycetota bacterium]|nr:MAG: SEL1-like repeat protein [Planctomycetota bacterium]
MKCFKCRQEIPDNSRFCPQCGATQDEDLEVLRQGCIGDAVECERAIAGGQGGRPYIRKSFDKRLPEWKRAAELGVREGQWLFARCFEEGFGVERNQVHAISWHIKAAEQGYPLAQNHVGSCYLNGNGVPKDEAEAVQWYRRAAEQGYAMAQSNLAWCLDTGTGVDIDETQAVEWHRKAAEQGDDTGQFNLAVHYEWGSGVTEDKTEAIKWYRKAALQGYEKAQEAVDRLTEELAQAEKDKAQKAKDAELRFRAECKEALADAKLTSDEKHQLKELAKSLELSKSVAKEFFEDEKRKFLKSRRKQHAKDAVLKFRIACKNALADGKVSIDEKDQLRELGKSLKLAHETTKHLFEDEKKIFLASQKVAPTKSIEVQFRKACKKVLADGKVTPDEKDQLKSLAKFFKMSNEAMKQILADEVRIFRQTHLPQRTS